MYVRVCIHPTDSKRLVHFDTSLAYLTCPQVYWCETLSRRDLTAVDSSPVAVFPVRASIYTYKRLKKKISFCMNLQLCLSEFSECRQRCKSPAMTSAIHLCAPAHWLVSALFFEDVHSCLHYRSTRFRFPDHALRKHHHLPSLFKKFFPFTCMHVRMYVSVYICMH